MCMCLCAFVHVCIPVRAKVGKFEDGGRVDMFMMSHVGKLLVSECRRMNVVAIMVLNQPNILLNI